MAQSVDFSSCCRLCLLDDGPLRPIFEDEALTTQLGTRIFTFLAIQVTIDDKISTQICDPCVKKIDNWESYTEKCLENQAKLQDFLKDSHENDTAEKDIHWKNDLAENIQNNEPTVEDEDIMGDIEPEVIIKHEPEDIEEEYVNPMYNGNDDDDSQTSNNIEVDNQSEISMFRSAQDSKQCMYCSKSFSTPGNRRKHEKIMHENREIENRYTDTSMDDSQNSMETETSQPENPEDDTDYQKIQFAGALKLKAANGPTRLLPTLSAVETCYTDKCKKSVMMFNTLTCICHGIQHKTIKRLFAHLRSLCQWFPVYTCYNCMITFADRSSVMRHSSKCQRRHLENLIRLSALKTNSERKIRLYQSYKCTKCSYTFNFYEDYCDHVDKEHINDDPPYNCDCTKSFSSVDAFQEHLHNACMLNYYCDVCFELFESMAEFKTHAEQAHDMSEGFVFLPIGGNVSTEKINQSFETSLNSLNASVNAAANASANAHTKSSAKSLRNTPAVVKVEVKAPVRSSRSPRKTLLNTRVNASAAVNAPKNDLLAESVASNNSEHEMVECAPDLEIESYYEAYTPPPSNKNWNSKSSCTVCGKTYSNYHNMMRHFKTHSEAEKTISCDYCDEMFRLKSQLKEHLVIEHGILDSKSSIKLAQDSESPDLDVKNVQIHPHKLNLASQSSFPCPECNIIFATLDEWTKHKRTHRSNTCEECGKQFSLASELEQHRSVHLTLKVYRDSKTLSYKSAQVSSSVEELVCTLCGVCFESPDELERHTLLHDVKMEPLEEPEVEVDVKPKRYSCETCNKHYVGYGGLWEHNKRYHPERRTSKDYPRQCKYCDKILQTGGAYFMHKQMHERLATPNKEEDEATKDDEAEDEDYFTCKRCFKVFTSKYNLKNHMKCHGINSGGRGQGGKGGKFKTYWCNICHQACQGYMELQSHKQEHEVEKMNELKELNHLSDPNDPPSEAESVEEMEFEEYKPDFNPELEVLAVKDNVIYPCDICDLEFTSKPALKKHKERHDSDLPPTQKHTYVYCKYCKIPFISVSKLNEHMEAEHDEIPGRPKPKAPERVQKFPCNLCKKVFDTSGALCSHQGWHKRIRAGEKSKVLLKLALKDFPRSIPKFQCKTCGQAFINDTALQIHILEVHRNINTSIVAPRCNMCDLDFDSQSAYEKHNQFHRIVEKKQQRDVVEKQQKHFQFSCRFCNKGFPSSEVLFGHVKQFHREKAQNQSGHVCPVCNRVFERPQALATHVKIHDRERFQAPPPKVPKVAKQFLYSCSICHVGFNVPKELRSHIISAHPF